MPTVGATGRWKLGHFDLLAIAILAITFFGLASIFNPSAVYAAPRILVIQNDRGGAVADRIRAIGALRSAGTPVEIRGKYCLSACTMYLNLTNICVSPNTKFGFHGPSSQLYGIALTPRAFDRWSTLMASYYPEPLRQWFLKIGRHRTIGFHEISGQDLIQMGIARCI